MRKLLMIAMLALLPVASRAQAPAQTGLSLGVRLGFAPAMGDAAKDSPLKDEVKSQIPLQLDAMFRVSPAVAVGAYFSYGFGQLPSDVSDFCDASGIDCSARSLRLGVQGTYTFNPASSQLAPWLGLGIGYEWLKEKAEAGGFSVTSDIKGFEFLNLQGGLDYKTGPQFAVGPFVMLSVGQFSKVGSADITDKAVHQWLTFGLRGKFDL